MIALDQLLEDIKSGEVTEVFACGTAAIITPIGRFKSEKFDVAVADGGSGKLTCELRDELLGIQLGEVEDPHNWMWKACRIAFFDEDPWNSNNSKGSWRIGNVLG